MNVKEVIELLLQSLTLDNIHWRNNMARCFKVTVVATGALNDSTYGTRSNYINCLDGVLYVIAERPSDVEKLVDYKKITKIEEVGIGYAIE